MKIYDKYIEEELTIAEFAERFLGINNFSTNQNLTEEIDISHMDIEILGRDLKNGKDSYNKINKFIIKPSVDQHYTDGKLRGTDLHRIIENEKEIHLKDHPDFNLVKTPINVVDFDIDNSHNYYANGRLNHNTVSGGKALAYHCSVRVRLNNTGKLNEYVSNEITNLINQLKETGSKISDKVTKIKLAETISNIKKIKSAKRIKEEHLSALMMTYELLKELKDKTK